MYTTLSEVNNAIKIATHSAIKEAKNNPAKKFNINLVFVHALDADANQHKLSEFKYNPELDYVYVNSTGSEAAHEYVKNYEIYDSGLIYTSGLSDSEIAKIISNARFRFVFYQTLKTAQVTLRDPFTPDNVKKYWNLLG